MARAQCRPPRLRRPGDNAPMRSSRRLISVAALLVLLSSPSGVASGSAQESGARGHPFGASCYRVYVINQRSDNLTLLDCTGRRLGSVGVGRNPHEVVVNRNGTRAYTSDLRAGTISEVSLVRQRRLRVAWVGGSPHGLSLGPDGRSLFVTAEGRHEVDVLTLPSLRVARRLRVGVGPHMLYPTPDGRRALATDPSGADVALIDLVRPRVLWTLPVSGAPEGAAFSPDGRLAYVASRSLGLLSVLAVSETGEDRKSV